MRIYIICVICKYIYIYIYIYSEYSLGNMLIVFYVNNEILSYLIQVQGF